MTTTGSGRDSYHIFVLSATTKLKGIMKKIFTALYFTAIVFSGCGTSYLKESSNVSQAKKSYDKILIVARAKDKIVRFKFEDQLVADLAAQGVAAASSKDVIKTESFDKEVSEKDIEKIRNKLVSEGYSGVIITNLINTAKYQDVVPGRSGVGYYPVRYGRFGRYYGAYPVSYWEPDQVEIGVEYTLESCLYDITVDQKDNLQWVGRFKVRDPNSLVKTIEKYSKELTSALLDQSIEN